MIELENQAAAFARHATQYLRKQQWAAPSIPGAPRPDLGLVVVIPCYDEPRIEATLHSLWACRRPACAVEVIVLINASRADPPLVHWRNQDTYRRILQWSAVHQEPRLAVHGLYCPDLDPRHAGVGLARKLGMDAALARFCAVAMPGGVIVCLDADCRCDPDYLTAIEAHFNRHPQAPGCTIYFEHPLDESPDPRLNSGIVQYELFLRYYVHGLRFSGFPYAYPTLGSCMAVRGAVYVQQGGMNRRRGAEDFYFLHKIIPLGHFAEIRTSRVLPAARTSKRVPFGTGRALRDWLAGRQDGYRVYSPRVFQDLKALFARLDDFYRADPEAPECLRGLPAWLGGYLAEQGFAGKLREIQTNAASLETFRKRFLHWFTAFRVLKYVHWATEHRYPKEPVRTAAATLLRWQGLLEPGAEYEARTLLLHFRRMDRAGRALPLAGGAPAEGRLPWAEPPDPPPSLPSSGGPQS